MGSTVEISPKLGDGNSIMLRLKKVHKALIIYVVIGLTILSVISRQGFLQNEVLETILEYENYTLTKLSDEIFTLSAYYENRPLENSPFVRILTISK